MVTCIIQYDLLSHLLCVIGLRVCVLDNRELEELFHTSVYCSLFFNIINIVISDFSGVNYSVSTVQTGDSCYRRNNLRVRQSYT